MKILLDTQAFIWFVENDKLLYKNLKKIIENNSNTILISIASLWEMTIKISLGKLKLNFSIEEMMKKITENGFDILPILPKHLIKLSQLEQYHNDPFDRIIISQGLTDDLIIISSDDKFDYYKVNRLWK